MSADTWGKDIKGCLDMLMPHSHQVLEAELANLRPHHIMLGWATSLFAHTGTEDARALREL